MTEYGERRALAFIHAAKGEPHHFIDTWSKETGTYTHLCVACGSGIFDERDGEEIHAPSLTYEDVI